MKRKKIVTFLMLSASVLGTTIPLVPTFATENVQTIVQQEQEINIPDFNLKKALNKELGQAENSSLTAAQLATIKSLNIDNQNIASIEGLQYCINLELLHIGVSSTSAFDHVEESNTISDISPLKELKNLKYLQMSKLQVTDFSPLKDLPLETNKLIRGDRLVSESFVQQLTSNEDGSVIWKNPDKDIFGNVMIPGDLQGGIYNKENNTITWSEEAFKQHSKGTKGNDHCLSGKIYDFNLFNESWPGNNKMGVSIYRQLQVTFFSPAVKAYQKIQELFSSDTTDEALFNPLSSLAIAENLTQQKIDKVKEQVNSLSDQDYVGVAGDKRNKKDLKILIQKAQELFDQSQQQESEVQTINLGGQGVGGYSDHSHDSGFSRVSLEVKDHKASLVKHSDYQFHWSGWQTSKYASIKLTDPSGNVLYNQSWKGNEAVKGNGYQKFGTFAQYDLPEGSTVEIYHAEGPWHRFNTNNNDNLKTKLEKTGYTYTYKMQNNQLVLINVDENGK
ncbi:TPA: putative mucin/carbohydrate-binding domain-containing protein [Enterococcus faecium]